MSVKVSTNLLLLMLRVLLQLLVLLHYVLLIELLGTLGINMGIQIRHSLALTVGHPLKEALKNFESKWKEEFSISSAMF